MCASIFDYDDGDFMLSLSDNMAIDSDEDMMMRMSDNIALDMNTGEIHITSSWSKDDED